MAIPLLLDPNIAYLVLVAAFLLAIFGLFTPGTGFIEVGAAFTFLIAGYAIYTLPINYWALVLLILGVFPFLLALRRSGHRRYLVISIIALIIGSAFLFRSQTWVPAVNPILATIVSGGITLLLWYATRKVLDALEERASMDPDRIIGAVGRARTEIDLEAPGTVLVGSEDWTARSEEKIPAGSHVRVIGREGFVLTVEYMEDPHPAEAER